MIKTLRITGILTAVAAVILLALPVVFGSGNGKDSDKLIDSETIIEKFKKIRESQTKKNEEEVSPLVKEASDFALYLNPPAPKITISTTQAAEISPPVPIVQFKLLSTCVHQSSPELSLALVDQPGEGLHWVRPSDKIGHLVVKEVQNGLLILNDGQKNVEVKIETEPTFESLLISDTAQKPSFSQMLMGRNTPDSVTSTEQRSGVKSPAANSVQKRTSKSSSEGRYQNQTEGISAQEEEEAQKFFKMLDQELQKEGVGENPTEGQLKKANEIAQKHFQELDNMKISGDEANKITDLGNKLDKEHSEPNRTKTSTSVKPRPRTQTPR